MADNETEVSKFDPRHRIIGAVILVSLAVIFIPMILDESSTPPELTGPGTVPTTPGNPAAPETKVVVTPVAKLDAPSETAPAAERRPDTAPADVKPVAELATGPETAPLPMSTVNPKPAQETAAETPKATRTTGTDKPAKGTKGWVVQVGVYSHVDNAKRVQDKLHTAGYSVASDNVTLDSGKAVRLRVGPYKEKGAAEKAQTQIQKLLGTTVIVRAAP
jgi:DedD protein